MSTEKHYNMIQKLLYAESVQKGRIVRNAKRPKKSTSFLRRNASHPPRWNVLNSMVLQKTQSQVDVTKSCTFSPAKQPLYNRRTALSSTTYHNSWSWALKLYQNIAVQRLIPSDSRLKEFSKRDYLAPLSLTAYPQSIKADTFSSRPTSTEDAILSLCAYQCDIGLRYHRFNRIWKTRRSTQGIQPIQAGSTIISSSTLLRSPYSRLPARKVLSGRRAYGLGKTKVHRECIIPTAFLYIQDKDSRGFQVVRPRDTSSSRREKNRLCYRSQNQPAHPAYPRRPSLSRIQEGLGGNRIPVSTPSVHPSPFYRGAKTITGKGQWSINPLYLEKARLPCDSYKSRPASRERLEILSRPSQDRAKYQRAEMGLLPFQDTHKTIFGKQGVFSSTFIRLQYNKLVQAAMSAGTVSIRHIADYSQGALGAACEISKIWQQKLTPTTETLCLQLGVRLCN